MKKIFCLSLMLFLLPIMVCADGISLNRYYKEGDVFFKDSVLSFYRYSDGSTHYQIYLDNKSVNDDVVTNGEHTYLYTLPKNVMIKSYEYESDYNSLTFTIYFESVDLTQTKIHCFIDGKEPSQIDETHYHYFDKKYCDDYVEVGKYYSSNDILLKYDVSSYPYFYDKSGSSIREYYFGNPYYAQAEFFPKQNNKDTYWAYIENTNGGYNGYISPVFEEYIPPKFELKCSPKTIKYGEKSTCTLYGTVDVNLTNLNFDFDPKEYKVLGATFPKGIENKKGDKQYNLEISENYDQSKEGFVLGVFELTGAQNKQYTDDVQVINLDYVDAKVSGKYSNLEDPIEIIALDSKTKEIKEEKNPDTSSSLSIIIPTVLFVVTLVVFFIVDKKKKIKNVS